MMAVGGSGFMCHVSNSFFRSKMPSMDDVLRKNPVTRKPGEAQNEPDDNMRTYGPDMGHTLEALDMIVLVPNGTCCKPIGRRSSIQ